MEFNLDKMRLLCIMNNRLENERRISVGNTLWIMPDALDDEEREYFPPIYGLLKCYFVQGPEIDLIVDDTSMELTLSEFDLWDGIELSYSKADLESLKKYVLDCINTCHHGELDSLTIKGVDQAFRPYLNRRANETEISG